MIRKYKVEDTAALEGAWRAATRIAHPFLDELFVEQEADMLRREYLPHSETWVIETGGGPVGFITLVGDEIGGLFLDPLYHGKGFGRALVDHAISLKGSMWLEVFEKNLAGRRFYSRYGFLEISRSIHDATGEVMLKVAFSQTQ